MECIIALDIGTSHAKAALIDCKGEILSQEKTVIPINRPDPNSAEHDPAELLSICYSLIQKVGSHHKEKIKAIIPTGYQFGLLILDKDDKPLGGISTLLDTRARLTYHLFLETFDPNWLYQRSGCPAVFHYPLARLFYLKEREPRVFDQINRIMSAKDYLIYDLIGLPISDASTSSSTQLLSLTEEKWDPQILSKIGIDNKVMPKIVSPYKESYPLRESVREKLNLSKDVRVIVGLYDSAALAIGMNALQPGEGFSNIGTSAMLRTVSLKPHLDLEDMQLQTYHFFDGTYLIGSGMNNGLTPIVWLKNRFSNLSTDQLIDQISEISPGADGLLCLPYLTGERDPRLGEKASGVLFGLRDIHTSAHVGKAMLEGVTFHLAAILQKLISINLPLNSISLGGGGSQNRSLTQMMADIFNTPIRLSKTSEPALLGNAILGFSNLNRTSVIDNSKIFANHGETIDPIIENVAKYENIRGAYNSLVKLSSSLFPKLSQFSNS